MFSAPSQNTYFIFFFNEGKNYPYTSEFAFLIGKEKSGLYKTFGVIKYT